jgi:hypothetical protein
MKQKNKMDGNNIMKNKYVAISTVLLMFAGFTTTASASVYEFNFTGQYTLLDNYGNGMDQQPISSTLTYDDSAGAGFSASLTIDNFDTYGATATIYDISLQRYADTQYIVGNMLADWNGAVGVPISMIWNASGLFNAIDYGLQVGDVVSGTNLIRGGVNIYDVGSATPASDGTNGFDAFGNPTIYNQGPAPIAMTTYNTGTLCTPSTSTTDLGTCMGNPISGGMSFVDDGIGGSPLIDGPFTGLNVNFDIGSGHSLTVTNISSVPVPAAAWLFGSGLLGLVGVARRKKS